MAPKQAFRKLVPVILAACIGGIGGNVLAAGDTTKADQPKVDCQKNPEHKDCKGKAD